MLMAHARLYMVSRFFIGIKAGATIRSMDLEPLIKLHFARFEFKYLLQKSLRDDIEKELQYFMAFDPFVENQPGYKYFVRSLYFDDPAYSTYYDKIDGIHTRAKFRIRTYSPDPDAGVSTFLELKGRYNQLVFKHRVQCHLNGETARQSGEKLAPCIISCSDNATVLDQFHFECYRKRLKPVVLIDYLRRPYISKYDPEFRLTFDEKITGSRYPGLYPGPAERAESILPGYTIMEVKFKYHMPAWFHRIIQSFELRRQSISKMCKGVEVCHLARNLE